MVPDVMSRENRQNETFLPNWQNIPMLRQQKFKPEFVYQST